MRRPVFAAIVLLVAIAYLYGGVQLIAVGGSIYYVLAGGALLASAILLWRGNQYGAHIYAALLVATLVWSLYEVGTDLWALAPRLGLLTVLGAWLLVGSAHRRAIAAAGALVVAAIFIVGSRNSVNELAPRNPTRPHALPKAVGEWQHYGNTTHGTRYALLDQIDAANVGRLQEIWHYRTGRTGQFKATPLQVGELLYVCTAMNVVVALDAETGAKRWEFDPKLSVAPVGFNGTCRGVSYYRAPDGYNGDCPARIIMGTTDARLMAIDAATGERCPSFGNGGEVNLLKGIGEAKPNIYLVTTPPLIARNVAVVGTRVADNFEVNEPSGVVRAYDAVTGRFAWAWDMGRPGVNTEPAEGEQYTRGTPNVWTLMSYDDALGLIYAPTGNSTPDFFGAHRTAESEKYASSVVALDVTNGSVRWSFQTVHHDVWDYDVPSQPTLIDLPQADGSIVPALVQPTKRGELFLLDRRTGAPLATVEEQPVPQGPVEHEWLAKTQPFSTGMPRFRPDVGEADMWGLTPFDQMWCRREFHRMRWEGHFTPPSVAGTLVFPGNAGGFNWGGVAVDEDRQLLVATPLIMGSRLALIPREQVPGDLKRYLQLGTPYAADIRMFMSPLQVPCIRPPYGRIAVIDLQTRQIVWNKRLGTTNESGPLGIKIGLRLPMGVPLAAGSMVTRGGLIFFGGGMDRYFRAFDVKTGDELWRDYLPAPAQATPMSYLSPRTKRQIVLITVPGADRFGMAESDDKTPPDPLGGHIIAYALPR
ncbi:MAG TPA: membrane-bound PQQ-dependent dehydrogenase, glucose/quinate/shikimate family [Steroidobacteraceae bacterium]|jgi:quinate dehydrogenase (quinone)